MSDELIRANAVGISKCADDCECQWVWIDLLNADGNTFAAGNISPAQARVMAQQLMQLADLAEARHAKNAGRLG
ncbi:MAG: hypothetical protein AAFU41_00745 [Pseudomonadota bacterium]